MSTILTDLSEVAARLALLCSGAAPSDESAACVLMIGAAAALALASWDVHGLHACATHALSLGLSKARPAASAEPRAGLLYHGP